MTNMLRVFGVEAHILDSATKPTDDQMSKLAEWKHKDEIAKVLLCGSINDDQVIYLSQDDPAATYWDNLKSVHKVKGQQTITALKWMLYKKAVNRDEEILAHIIKMRQLHAKLHQLGSVVPEPEFQNVLISSLPQSWEGFILTFMGA